MNIVDIALSKAIDYLESKGMSREKAARKIVKYIVLNYLAINQKEEAK